MDAGRPVSIIIDTNIWISYLISGRYKELDDLIESGRTKLLFSEELIGEFVDIATREKFHLWFDGDDIMRLLWVMGRYENIVEVIEPVYFAPDPDDDFLFSLAKAGQADYLITGDKGLLGLALFEDTRIISMSAFFLEMGSIE
jgi:uncharacterized protein